MIRSNTDMIPKTITGLYKIRPSKKCGCKGKIESTKHSRRNSNRRIGESTVKGC
jgi:hypothetical protein